MASRKRLACGWRQGIESAGPSLLQKGELSLCEQRRLAAAAASSSCQLPAASRARLGGELGYQAFRQKAGVVE